MAVSWCFPPFWFKERNDWKWDVIELQISTEKDKGSFQIYSCSGFQGLLLKPGSLAATAHPGRVLSSQLL